MEKTSFERGVEERRGDGWCVESEEEEDDELVCVTSLGDWVCSGAR